MKILAVLLTILLANCCFAQKIEENEIEIKLYLATHIKNELKPTDKLEVYLTRFPEDSALKIPLKLIGKKIRDNVYTVNMPQMKFWHIGFKIGIYGQAIFCVDNREGEAGFNEDFNIRLEKYQASFTNPRFLPPCIRGDED